MIRMMQISKSVTSIQPAMATFTYKILPPQVDAASYTTATHHVEKNIIIDARYYIRRTRATVVSRQPRIYFTPLHLTPKRSERASRPVKNRGSTPRG